VTFLFTDIVRSTARWEQNPETMSAALVAHDELLRGVVEEHSGQVFKHTGDGMCAVFASAQQAVQAAIAAPLPGRAGAVRAAGDGVELPYEPTRAAELLRRP
jgi:class 3 adenylate cyclase